MEHRATTETLAISTRNLVKHFGEVRAVDGIDLAVPRGMIFGILGPNGAGKTTLLRILATLTKPDAGSAQVMGHDVVTAPREVQSAIALTGQFASLDEDLTGRENLALLARLWGYRGREARARADGLLAAFDLEDAANRQVNDFSGGMRRRLDIAASLVVTPEVLFLDEPTTGLDPNGRQDVWRMIRALAAQGVTVLLTTQYLEEADQLAARIAVIDRGKKIAEGSSRELKAAVGSGVLHVSLADRAQADHAADLIEQSVGSAPSRQSDGAALSVQVKTPGAANKVLALLSDSGIEITDFSMGAPSLEEVFFALTKAAEQPATGEPT